MIKRILYLFSVAAFLTSCADSYNIQGASSVSSLDGSKLYLKAIKDGEIKNIDSCEVVHGKFKFAGLLDTTSMASLYMDEQSIMPVVIEQGNIVIRIDEATQKVSGSPLNELLYDFLDKHNQLENRLNEAEDDPFSNFKELSDKDIERIKAYKGPGIDELIEEMEDGGK